VILRNARCNDEIHLSPPPPPIILSMLDFLSSPIWEPPHFLPRREDTKKYVLKTNFVEEVVKNKVLIVAISFSCVNHSVTVQCIQSQL